MIETREIEQETAFQRKTTLTGVAQEGAPKVAVHTLGCKLNYAETSTIQQQFLSRGFELADTPSAANVFILNTCSVTENAEKECRQLIRRILRSSPETFIAVTGCYAQLRPEEIASIEGVDVVLGAKEKFEIFDRITSFQKFDTPQIFSEEIGEAKDFHVATTSVGDERTRAFLKVQDGCDYSCSFCTIPKARGESRSASVESILAEARRLSAEGFREIVLSGVNVGDFGRKIGTDFYTLVRVIEEDEKVTARLRISSIEPNLLTEEIIDLIAQSKKFCPHFHIPLQSGSAKILRLMQRRYKRELYQSRVEYIRSKMPDAAIGVDVIVGFPGETDQEFEETYQFLHGLDITYLHVFTYSERPGTKASIMEGSVNIPARKERNKLLRILSEKKKHAFYQSQIGREVEVLVEGHGIGCAGTVQDTIEGYSENYVRVQFDANLPSNVETARVKLNGIYGGVMKGELLNYTMLTTRNTLLPIL